MSTRNDFFSGASLILARLSLLFVVSFLTSFDTSASTLTITDDNGEKAPLEIQSGDYVRVTTASDGDVFLVLKGFTVTLGDGSDGGSGSSNTGGTSGGTDGSGGDTGNSGGDTDGSGGDTGNSGGDTGSSGGDTGGSGGDTGGSSGGSGSSGGTDVEVPTEGYCAGFDPDLADCKEDQNFDPWIAGTGEVPYWIRNRLTEVFPFTLPARADAADTHYGYLQLTTGERKRNAANEDIFHMWFSETPNGPVLEGTNCEWYGTQAKTYFYWTQDETLQGDMCFLGEDSRLMYVNFETRCMDMFYSGTCNADNLRKSSRKYQFDVSRRIRGY